MTILCVASENLHGIWPCSIFGEHKVTCLDHELNGRDRPGTCRGCLPRLAERGFLCQHHYEMVEHGYSRWGTWSRMIDDAEGRPVTPEGRGAIPDGYIGLPLTALALDECLSFLRDRGDRTLDVWVHDHAGARNALHFAAAALNAWNHLQVEERERKFERVRCAECGFLAFTEHPTKEYRSTVVVECQNCGNVLNEVKLPTAVRWFGSESCEGDDTTDDPLRHLGCTTRDCRCGCHEMGPTSRPRGLHTLWDADIHAVDPWLVPRQEWVIEDKDTIRPVTVEERTAA